MHKHNVKEEHMRRKLKKKKLFGVESGEDFDSEDEIAIKTNRLHKIIEAKQERRKQQIAIEAARKAEEKRVKDLSLLVRPGEGKVNWKSIVEVKRRKQRQLEELEREGKPDPFHLDPSYDCVKHV